MLAKMFNIGTLDSTGLLNHVVRDTATNIHTVKKNWIFGSTAGRCSWSIMVLQH
jgi:hypothetical protein